ncbi:MAG TPA: hypothetical protein DDY13_05810 [Cytophagales bacterium]|mgnify:CR=1 FL=1|jgi:uncharacterized membrane protein HdeD (DUF308 family)|nr:hypothetical protein [Cytophagales bacterium]
MSSFLKTVTNTVKHWYIPLIVGLIFIGIGIYTLISPLESYLALSIIFSLSFLFSGLAEIIFSISNRNEIDNWGWTLAFGILTFLLGVLLIVNPAISMTTLPLYVGFIVLFRSIMGISYALELKNYGVLDWGNLMAVGILGVLFSLILIWNPVFAGYSIVLWTGLALIAGGVFSIYLSLKLKKIKNIPVQISKELKEKYKVIKEEIQNELNQK